MTQPWPAVCLLLCAVAVCSAEEPAETASSPALMDARRAAGDLLASVCGRFECTYSDVVVADASFADDVNYVVRFTCDGKRCPEALLALVERAVGTDLSFSLRPPPVEVERDPFDPQEPGPYDLIHEIDPDPGQ